MTAFQLGVFCSLGSAFFWAVGVILFKLSGEKLPPLTLNLFKNVVSILLLVPAAILIDGSPTRAVPGDRWLLLAVSGVVGITLSDTLFLAALNRLGAGLNAAVDCLYSPSMVLLAWLFLGERVPPLLLLGGGLILTAVLLCSASRPIPGRTSRDVVNGILLASIGMVLIAASVVMVKRILDPERILWITSIRLVAGTVPLLPLALLAGERAALARAFRPSGLWKVAIPGALCGTVLAMGLWVGGMTLLPVSHSSVLNQTSTIFIFVLAATVLREPVTKRRIAAVGLAFAGALVVLTA